MIKTKSTKISQVVFELVRKDAFKKRRSIRSVIDEVLENYYKRK